VDGDGHAVFGEEGDGIGGEFEGVFVFFVGGGGSFVAGVGGCEEVGVSSFGGDYLGEGVGLGEDEGMAGIDLVVNVDLGEEEADCG